MHEVGIMESILQLAEEKAREAKADRIDSIRMCIGEASGVVTEALEFAFEALAPGTMAEGAEFISEVVKVKCMCERCNLEFSPDGIIYICPKCGDPVWKITQGKELYLLSMEVSIDNDE